MSRLDEFNDAVRKHGGIEPALDRLLPGGTTTPPFPAAGHQIREMQQPALGARQELVHKVLQSPVSLTDVNPRELRSSQPGITREGVAHYLRGRQWEHEGATYADKNNIGNKFPVVYHRARDSAQILLSGHHRATAALMRGTPLRARVVEGP